ncbi:hypothetical protein VL07_14630 [Bacillus safensis]|nr:hypothetical protein VL07_14630 [Bacillus safensis]KML52232.1 hypothetical protein VL18_04760 [Bacillus safensis]KMN77461.1 hypothetical protein VK99_14980 [Bacillus safensis]
MNLYTHFSVKKTIFSYKVDVNRKYLKEKKKKANLWKHRDAKPCPKVNDSFFAMVGRLPNENGSPSVLFGVGSFSVKPSILMK